MTLAICFKCGEAKADSFAKCNACGSTPSGEIALALSLALCEHFSSKTQLFAHAYSLKHHLRLGIESKLVTRARQALKDPQLLARMGLKSPATTIQPQPTVVARTPASSVRTGASTAGLGGSKIERNDALASEELSAQTALHQSPFWLLGVTVRDDRRRIVELAEQRSLESSPEICQKSRSDLINPRTRLASEIAWLPGVSPRKAEHLVRLLDQDLQAIRSESGLPTLAHANLMAAAFEVMGEISPQQVSTYINQLASLVEYCSEEDVRRDINEDRAISGFPEIKSAEAVHEELNNRKRYFRDVVKASLNRMSSNHLIEVMTLTVDSATNHGASHAPKLIDDLVDSYEVESQVFLQSEAENVTKLIQAARDAAGAGESAVSPIIDRLEAVARNWDKVAQPIQLSAKARGIDHSPSRDLAFSIRSMGIDLFNEHDMLIQSQRITDLLHDLFAELPEIVERVEQDVEALEGIFRDRNKAEDQRKTWADEITYEAEVGLLLKDTLKISPEGLQWKQRVYPLDAITRVRWGGVRHSMNGIPTGTNFTIAFGDNRSEAVVELRREATYHKFIDKLWRAVGVRLLTDLLDAVKTGRQISIGGAIIEDSNVTLTKHRLLGANERVRLEWHQVHVWSADGSFYIGAKDDKKTYAVASYIHTANAHVLEQVIRMFFKTAKPRLSSLLETS